MMTDKQPTNAEIRECHEQAQADIELTCHESQGESMSDIDSAHDHRGILSDRLEEAEHNLLETHVAWQQGIKRIKELEDKLVKAEREDKAAKHDIERLMDSVNFELNRADKAESRIKALEAKLDKIGELYSFDVPLAPHGNKAVWLSELKAILEQKCE